MLPEDRLREGDPEESLALLQEQVRRDPSDAKLRVFLFQLLAVLGRWDRALNQLNVAAELDPGTLAMAQTYRTALGCEALRAAVFEGRRSPLVFGQPEPWLALLLESLRLLTEGRFAQAGELREKAFEEAPPSAGAADEHRFEWIADADMRLGPVLEAIVNGAYYWIPFHRIREISLDGPEDLRDLVWTPARFTWANGGQAVGLIPTRYPGSETSPDGGLRLARRTEWSEAGPGAFVGLGQRVFATDAGEHALLDLRRLCMDAALGEPGAGLA